MICKIEQILDVWIEDEILRIMPDKSNKRENKKFSLTICRKRKAEILIKITSLTNKDLFESLKKTEFAQHKMTDEVASVDTRS